MKEVVIISGKGGTGKTSITASFAALAKNAVFTDCDVDAADLHLLLNPHVFKSDEFIISKVAKIDKAKCTECGECLKACRFDSITSNFKVLDLDCEGCTLCKLVCPADAITMHDKVSGEWFISNTRFGLMSHAALKIGEENSGRLVSLVREHARELAKEKNVNLIISDGPPGTSCPVIASITGSNLVVIVTEPTLSGIHDLERVVKLTKHFKIKTAVIINKSDINTELSEQIEKDCEENEVKLLGKISYDTSFTEAMVEGKTIIEFAKNKITKDLEKIWNTIENMLEI